MARSLRRTPRRRATLGLLAALILLPACNRSPATATSAGEATPLNQDDARALGRRREPADRRADRPTQPPAPALDGLAVEVVDEGELGYPEGIGELRPASAVHLKHGLLFAGAAGLEVGPGLPPRSWAWTGFVAEDRSYRPTSTRLGVGEIAVALADGQGGAVVIGQHGGGEARRGWLATIDGAGGVSLETELGSDTQEGPETLSAILPGAAQTDELALILGRRGEAGWLGAIDRGGVVRWQRSLANDGQTQPCDLVRLDGDAGVLVVGARRKKYAEAWWAIVPARSAVAGVAEAADSPALSQDRLTIPGAEPEQTLRAIVDLGAAGFAALGTAHEPGPVGHQQLFVAGFDRSGAPTTVRILEAVRANEVVAATARGDHALFLLVVASEPLDDRGRPQQAVALLELAPHGDGSDAGEAGEAETAVARVLEGSEGWSTAGFVDQRGDQIALYGQRPAGIVWRLVAPPGL